MSLLKRRAKIHCVRVLPFLLLALGHLFAQEQPDRGSDAGHVPIISGGAGYIHNVSGGAPTLEPQINPILVFPFGQHVLLESRTDFTGFFQRENQTSGPFKGKVFKTVEFAQLDWLANDHITVVAGKYLLPFGLYNERLEPIWIRNLQDSPLTASIGTRTSGAGDGLMLRGVATQNPNLTARYSVYASVRSGTNQLEAARAAGIDASVFLPGAQIEIGTSWQRFLQEHRINNSATYLSWQPLAASVDVKAEYDYSYYGHGYWFEAAYRLDHTALPTSLQKVQIVGRMQELFPLNGGGNGLPRVRTNRVDLGINYYLRDDLRLVSSYGRSLSSDQNTNIWNLGFTYRFMIPLWFGGNK